MPTLAEVRQKYPQYGDMSDQVLADALHRKFYSDIPRADFDAKIGLQSAAGRVAQREEAKPAFDAADAGRSVLSGIRTGIEGGIGAVGWANKKTGEAAGWLAGQAGASQGAQDMISSVVRRAVPGTGHLASSDEIQGATSKVVGEPHQPQTKIGEYARTVGEFLPSAVAGPGGVMRKAAMAAVPGIASEAAGQLTEGSDVEPFARLVGGLAGGAAAVGRTNLTKAAAQGAPTADALKVNADRLYEGMRQLGIKYDANAYAHAVQGIMTDLVKKGLRPSVAKEAFGLADELVNEIGKSPDFDDIGRLVQMTGELARGAAKSENLTLNKAFRVIRDRLMDFEKNAPFVTNVPISRERLNLVRSNARQLALRTMKQRVLDEVAENATAYRSGDESGLRNQLFNLTRSKRGKKLFSEQERNALLAVAKGRKPLEMLGKFGFDLTKIGGNAAFLPALTTGATAFQFGPEFGALVAGVGTAAKALSPLITNRAFERVQAAIRSGKLGDKTFMDAAKRQRLQARARMALSAIPAVAQASN